jgi:hypothetical protein
MSGCGEGVPGNREVPRIEILSAHVDLSGVGAEASSKEEGGSWGKPGFLHATEPKAEEAA